MFKKSAFWIGLPIVSGSILSLYYIGGSPIFSKQFDDSIYAQDNKELQAKLAASKSKDYSNELLGYETNIDSNIRNKWEKWNTLQNFFPYLQKNSERDSLRRINIIREHSVKLETPCGSGTGWFLDYVMPKDNSYPTKWFIATNAHVISDMSFKSNDYAQPLPRRLGRGCRLPRRGMLQTPLIIWKEKINSPEENVSIESSTMWDFLYGQGKTIQNVYNAEKYKKSDHEVADLIYYATDHPKLFYVPINFLGKNIGKYSKQNFDFDYYKDFAVLEIDFKNANTAKFITRNFYEKYDRLNGSQKENSLNIFSEELLNKTTGNQLFDYDATNDYYVAGYASNGKHTYKSSGNYSPERGGASKLTYDSSRWDINMKNKHNERILGHVDVGIIDEKSRKNRIKWNGSSLIDWGYNYILDNSWLSSGTSGSLTTDSQGNVLGLYRMHDSSNKLSFIEPLRSKGIYKDGKIVFPEYDLIEGAPVQISSYKSQIQKYYLSKQEETALSKYRNWSKK